MNKTYSEEQIERFAKLCLIMNEKRDSMNHIKWNTLHVLLFRLMPKLKISFYSEEVYDDMDFMHAAQQAAIKLKSRQGTL